MERWSLRLRIGLFFVLIAAGGVLAILAGLWVGQWRSSEAVPAQAFVAAGTVATVLLLGLVAAVWMRFDDHVAKPVEALAAQMRVAARSPAPVPLDMLRYLGDLGPATAAFQSVLAEQAENAGMVRAPDAERLMLEILSEIPVAVIVVNAAKRIVLYDGQACELLEREAPARIGGSVFDYFEAAPLRDAFDSLARGGEPRRALTLRSLGGREYAGHVCRLGNQPGFTLMLEALDVEAERPLTYDVGLLDADLPEALAERPLADLAFVVFDTETTGLDPARDAVVQLAAVRVLRGRIVPGEAMDTLVYPGRPIPPLATRVHRITDEMVAGAPPFREVCARFCSFATDAVVVAHNAPFDMAFVERECREAGRVFEPAVLDTVLMSAVLFGGAAQHSLDAICARMGIDIPDEARHTALGDATATAQALVCMIRALADRGVVTYGDYQREARKHRGLMRRTAASGA